PLRHAGRSRNGAVARRSHAARRSVYLQDVFVEGLTRGTRFPRPPADRRGEDGTWGKLAALDDRCRRVNDHGAARMGAHAGGGVYLVGTVCGADDSRDDWSPRGWWGGLGGW